MTTSETMVWDLAQGELRAQIDEESFNTWIEPVRWVSQREGVVVLGVPSIFYRNWLANNYQPQLEQSLEGVLGHPVEVRYQVEPAEQPAAPVVAQAELPRGSWVAKRPLPSIGITQTHARNIEVVACPLNRNSTFENFVVGESNRFAYAAAQAVADPSSRAYNPLFVYGGVGLGKTHLMQAIGHQLQSYGSQFQVLYVSSEAFMNGFIDAVAQKKLNDFRNCFRNVDLLLVDDVQFFAGAEQTQTEFFHTFNVLFDAGKKIVISSDRPPKELHSLEERLRSRFEWGLIVDVQPPDVETRLAILRKKAHMMGLELRPEVASLIAERIRTNLRKLEGALTRFSAHSTMTRQPITIEVARQLLGPFVGGSDTARITVERIQMSLCDYFSLSLHDMVSGNRQRKFARPRQLAAYLCRELTQSSYPEIAKRFGGRDHTSILHAYRKVKDEAAADLNLQNLLKHLTKMIKEEAQNTRVM